MLCAALTENIPLLRHLAAARADVNERVTARGEQLDLFLMKASTPLMVAAYHNVCPDVLRCLLDLRADPHARNRISTTALHFACVQGNIAAIELLLDVGVNIRLRDKTGWEPIHVGASTGRSDVVELLLERGALVDTCTYLGTTSLTFAAFGGHLGCCQLLLHQKAEVNHVCKPWGPPGLIISTALRLASPFLPNSGPLFHLSIMDGCTALQSAAMIGHFEVVTLLLEARADPSIKHRAGTVAKDLAHRGRHASDEDLLGRARRCERPAPAPSMASDGLKRFQGCGRFPRAVS